jgi:hypothetical protein
MKRSADAAKHNAAKAARLAEPVNDAKEVRDHLFKAGGLMVPNTAYSGPGKFVLASPGEGEFAESEPVELSYFAIRALGHVPQLCLELGGYPYRYTVYTVPYFMEHVKHTLRFGRLPCVRTIPDDMEIVQSKAVLRYVAELSGLAGKSVSEHARCDMLYEMLQSEGRLVSADIEKLKGRKSLDVPGDLNKITRRETLELNEEQKALAAIKFWEDMLGRSATKWLLGGMGDGGSDGMCYVDVALFEAVRPYTEILKEMGCVHLCGFVSSVLTLPRMENLISSGRLMPSMGEGYLYQGDELVPAP